MANTSVLVSTRIPCEWFIRAGRSHKGNRHTGIPILQWCLHNKTTSNTHITWRTWDYSADRWVSYIYRHKLKASLKFLDVFTEGILWVVVATVAFGMGLDCPNVRQITAQQAASSHNQRVPRKVRIANRDRACSTHENAASSLLGCHTPRCHLVSPWSINGVTYRMQSMTSHSTHSTWTQETVKSAQTLPSAIVQ